jgi:predicted ATPase
MKKARLTSLSVERFKSFGANTKIELRPLTIILGRNNSGKSSLIQSLLLLKQTLADPRPDVMLRLEGIVDAFSLRELTTGWPSAGGTIQGPTISVEWDSEVDILNAIPPTVDRDTLARNSGVDWLVDPPAKKTLKTSLTLNTEDQSGNVKISSIELRSIGATSESTLRIDMQSAPPACTWNGKAATKITVDFDNFIPYLNIDKKTLGPRSSQRAYYNAYLVLFEQPLDALKKLLLELHYLGSSRLPPVSLFKPATADPSEIGVSGEFAAQLLHRRKLDLVHFLPLLQLTPQGMQISQEVHALPLGEAVNSIMKDLSIDANLRVQDIEQVGFQIMFGNATIAHVGRGLGQLLPLVELGLFADPLRFSGAAASMPLDTYSDACDSFGHIILEEPEAHLHPKVASRLAHWLISLAQSNRRVIVETHSDHLVRRLRGLIARAGTGSSLEKWLLENVSIVSVEQDSLGMSSITTSKLTSDGGLGEVWPSDFMDEASNEDSAIYYAQLNKSPVSTDLSPVRMIEGNEPELDREP